MIANLSYLNKLVDQYNNTYHHSIKKNLLMVIIMKTPKFKVNDRDKITKYKNVFSNGYIENWSREIFITYSI